MHQLVNALFTALSGIATILMLLALVLYEPRESRSQT